MFFSLESRCISTNLDLSNLDLDYILKVLSRLEDLAIQRTTLLDIYYWIDINDNGQSQWQWVLKVAPKQNSRHVKLLCCIKNLRHRYEDYL